MLIAVFNCIFIPLTLSFPSINDSLQESSAYNGVNVVSTVFFLADILLQMNTTFITATGEEVTDKRKVVLHYLRGMFLIDLLSSVPVEMVLPRSQLRLLNILKLMRISKLTTIINRSALSDENKSVCRIFHLLFLLFLFMHVLGCLWHAVVQYEDNQLWIMPLDYRHTPDPTGLYAFYAKPDTARYARCLYMSLLFIGGNELGPVTDL